MLLALPAPADDVVIVVAAVCAGTVCAGRHAVCTHARLLTDLCSLASCSGPWHNCGSVGCASCALNDLAALWLRCSSCAFGEWPMLRPDLITAGWLIGGRPTHAPHKHEHACGMRTYKIHTSRMLVMMRACAIRHAMCTDSMFRRSAMAAPFFWCSLTRAAQRSAAARRHHKNQRMRALLRMSHQLVRHEGGSRVDGFGCQHWGFRRTEWCTGPQHGVICG